MSIHCYHYSTMNPLEYEAKYILKTLPITNPNLKSESSANSIGIGFENGKMLSKNAYY